MTRAKLATLVAACLTLSWIGFLAWLVDQAARWAAGHP